MSSDTPTRQARLAPERGQTAQRDGWQPEGDETACDGCGADLTQWSSTEGVRELRRVLGRNDGALPGCPRCVEASAANPITTLSGAIRHSRGGKG